MESIRIVNPSRARPHPHEIQSVDTFRSINMYEIDFLPVGNSNGDAICVRHGNDNEGYHLHVIDGGYPGKADAS